MGTFLSGISSTFICECLLENQRLWFNQVYKKAHALELSRQTSETYFLHVVNSALVQANRSVVDSDQPSEPSWSAAAVSRQSKISNKRTFMCYFCGGCNWCAVPSVQPGMRSVIIVARLVTTSNAARVVKT